MTTLLADASALCLPQRYEQQTPAPDAAASPDESYWREWRLDASASAGYQWRVYQMAARSLARLPAPSVLDVGCGAAIKLERLLAPVCGDITGVDTTDALNHARRCFPGAVYHGADLEHADLDLGRTFDVIICADVLEHLRDPAPALRFMRRCAHAQTRLFISTPDRDRLRGRGCLRSPKPEHVREWARGEFTRYLRKHGFAVERSRLTRQDDAPPRTGLWDELRFRLRLRDKSPFACHTARCRVRDEPPPRASA